MRCLDLVLERLPDARRSGASWRARCPIHQGRRRSLSITELPSGAVLVHCFAGCAWRDIVKTIGLEPRDLWEVRRG